MNPLRIYTPSPIHIQGLTRRVTAWVCLLCIVTLAACGGSDSGVGDSGGSADTTPPTVSTTNPASGAGNVPVNASVSVSFSETMDCATLTISTFTLSGGALVAGNVACNSNTATFIPASSLADSTIFTASLITGVKDQAGNALAATYSWSFTTVSPPPENDTTPPEVSSTIPADNATNVALATVVTANFSEAIDCDTLVFFIDDYDVKTPGNVVCNGDSASFTPLSALKEATNYRAIIEGELEDLAGNYLGQRYVWTFRTTAPPPPPDTTPPEVSSTIPVNDAQHVAIDTTVKAIFSEAMDCNTLTDATFTLIDSGVAVSGVVTCSGDNATFSPATDLAVDTVYTATVTTGVKDLAGNALAVDYSWSFTTAGLSSRLIFGDNNFNLFIINDDGTGRVTLANSPDRETFAGISPSGRVVYNSIPTAGGSFDIFSVLPDGTGTATLASSVDNEVVKGITASGRVVYSRKPTSAGQNDLYSVNDDGTGTAVLANSADIEDFSSLPPQPYTGLTWGITASNKVIYERSPAGGGARDIYIINADGTGEVTLAGTSNDERFPNNTVDGWVIYQRGTFPSGPYYTVIDNEAGDGARPLSTTVGGIFGYESGRVITRGFPTPGIVAFYSVNPADGTSAVIVSGPNNSTDELTFKALTDGRLIYARRLGGDLYSVPISGDTPTTLASSSENASFKGITATGRIVYASGGVDIYSINPDGTDKVTLANSSDTESYRASTPDGRVIYERIRVGECADIYIVDADGGGAISLDTSTDCKQFAGISPAGRVLYLRNVSGAMHLYSVRFDGTDPIVLNTGGSVFYTSY